MYNNSIKIETGSLEVHPLTAAVTCKTKNSIERNSNLGNVNIIFCEIRYLICGSQKG